MECAEVNRAKYQQKHCACNLGGCTCVTFTAIFIILRTPSVDLETRFWFFASTKISVKYLKLKYLVKFM